MKNKISLKRVSVATITGSIAMLVLVPWIVGAQPSAVPTGGNVEANFFSVQLPTGPKMTGSFGRYVGRTAVETQGTMGGYAGAKTRCSNEFPDSHVCTAAEIMNSIEHGVAVPLNGRAWINNGPPAYVSDVSNDCAGWNSNNNNDNPVAFSVYGSIWNFERWQSLMATCGRFLPVACCAY